MNPLEDEILQWNLRFRYDRRWRKKYNLAFGSKEHLEANQIDIFFDLLEDRLFERLEKDYIESRKNQDDYRTTGKLLKEQKLTEEEEDRLFKKIKI